MTPNINILYSLSLSGRTTINNVRGAILPSNYILFLENIGYSICIATDLGGGRKQYSLVDIFIFPPQVSLRGKKDIPG